METSHLTRLDMQGGAHAPTDELQGCSATPATEALPRYPVLGRGLDSPFPTAPRRVACLLDSGTVRLTVNARMAMAQALRLCCVGRGDEVLLPAYHCPTMVHPVIWSGATPRFYRLTDSLEPDANDLRIRIGDRTRALVVVHFFGRPVSRSLMQALQAMCIERGISLIEDCAHALLGGSADRPIGQYADYAVASLMKFLPIDDGGCLVSRQHKLAPVVLQGTGPIRELRSAMRALDRAAHHGDASSAAARLGRLLQWPTRCYQALRPAWRAAQDSAPSFAREPPLEVAFTPIPLSEFDPAWLNVRMSAFSRWVCARSNWGEQAARRQYNEKVLREVLSDLRGGRVFLPEPEEDVVPYVLAVLLDQPDPVFAGLLDSGMPAMRWNALSPDPFTGPCPDSARLARALIHLPCHQSLTPDDMRRMGKELCALADRHASH